MADENKNDPPAPPAGDPPKDEGKPPAGDPSSSSTEAKPVTMTQTELDALIARTTAKAKSTTEKEFRDYLEAQNMTEADRLKAEKAAADTREAEARAEVIDARLEATAERLALRAGVPVDRVERAMRMLGKLDPDTHVIDGKPDPDAIGATIGKLLDEVPELKGATTPPGSAGGEHSGGTGKNWTKAEVAALTPDEFDKHEAEIMTQMQAGTVK